MRSAALRALDVADSRRSGAPLAVSIRAWKLIGSPRARDLRHEQSGGHERRQARSRQLAPGRAEADPVPRPSAQCGSPRAGTALPAATGSDDRTCALLGLIADVGAKRPAVGRDDRKLLDRHRGERRLPHGVDMGRAAGIDAARGKFVQRRNRARRRALRRAPCAGAPTARALRGPAARQGCSANS